MNPLYHAVLRDLRDLQQRYALDLPDETSGEAASLIDEYILTGDPVLRAQVHKLLVRRLEQLQADSDFPSDFKPLQAPGSPGSYLISDFVSRLLHRAEDLRALGHLRLADDWNSAVQLADLLLTDQNGWPHRTTYSEIAELATSPLTETYQPSLLQQDVDLLLTDLKEVPA